METGKLWLFGENGIFRALIISFSSEVLVKFKIFGLAYFLTKEALLMKEVIEWNC